MERGSKVKLEIEKCAFGGDGLARLEDGRIVFVPGTLPGETVIAEITAVKPNYLRAKAVQFGPPSPHRVEPGCSAFGRCVGCTYCHATYEYETELKNRQLTDFVTGAGLAPLRGILPPLAPAPDYGYRNKLQLHVNKEGSETQIGYVASDNQTVTEITACPLAGPEINAELARFLADPGCRHSVHNRMTLTFRYTPRDGVKFWRNNAPRNASWLRENTSLGELAVPQDGFFQVNPGGVEVMIGEVRELLAELRPEYFVDVYCGVGLFSAAAHAEKVPHIRGVELSEDAVKAAEYNLTKLRDAADARFVAADAVAALPEILAETSASTVIAVDPPRTGLSLKAAHLLSAADAAALLYISCHPATWTRDAGRLAKGGWKLRQVRMVNQFARTAHFELVSVFVKD